MTRREELEVELTILLGRLDAQETALRDRWHVSGDLTIYDRSDTNGRPIMLDLLCARATALAALVQLEQS